MPAGRPKIKPRQLEAAPLSSKDLKTPPAGLSAHAGAIWCKTAPMLAADGRLSERTRDAFIRYCKVAALFDETHKLVDKLDSPVTYTEQGRAMVDPHIQALRIYEGMVSSLSDRFCMTPRSLAQAGLSGTTKAKSAFSEFDI